MQDRSESNAEGQADGSEAFDALQLEVLYVRRDIETLSNGLAQTRPPDYTISLGEIAKGLSRVVERLSMIEKHPALKMTPATHQQLLADGGRVVMREPLERLNELRRSSERLNEELAGIIGSARRQDQQLKWLLVTGATAFVAGLVLSPFFARLLPFGLDSRVAAMIMASDRWHAGASLMEAENPQDWRGLQAAATLWQTNETALSSCQEAAAKTQKVQRCTIDVSTGPATNRDP